MIFYIVKIIWCLIEVAFSATDGGRMEKLTELKQKLHALWEYLTNDKVWASERHWYIVLAILGALATGFSTYGCAFWYLEKTGVDYTALCPLMIPWALIMLVGQSGSGKSYCGLLLMAQLAIALPDTKLFVLDYKGAEEFDWLRSVEGSRYYYYTQCVEGLAKVHGILRQRLEGDRDRHPVFVFIDEYNSMILHLLAHDKKQASICQSQLNDILFMGRSLQVGVICSCQRPDATVLPSGSRDQFAVRISLSTLSREAKEMVFGDAKEQIPEDFTGGQSRGFMLTDGKPLRQIRVPTINNMPKLQRLIFKIAVDDTI
ncbi:AAA family ATPase [Oscillospiraceae bacterium LTW-04]|nr:hypothetical protein RBH76_06990 [Oscillospiraceae bacterium MB24-C1]